MKQVHLSCFCLIMKTYLKNPAHHVETTKEISLDGHHELVINFELCFLLTCSFWALPTHLICFWWGENIMQCSLMIRHTVSLQMSTVAIRLSGNETRTDDSSLTKNRKVFLLQFKKICIYMNNLKRCSVHARPVAGSVTLSWHARGAAEVVYFLLLLSP